MKIVLDEEFLVVNDKKLNNFLKMNKLRITKKRDDEDENKIY